MKISGIILVLISLTLGFITFAWSHEKHQPAVATKEAMKNKEIEEVLVRANTRYLETVKPIFRLSCFDCHSNQTRFPWYYRVPLVKRLIDADISEATKHINVTQDFPFQGHGSPEEHLNGIENAVRKNEMPPFRYRMMHPNSSLNSQEREVIFRWISQVRSDLQNVDANSNSR